MAAISAPRGAEYARILGLGAYRPSRVVTNAEICERIDSSDEWIRERSGIESRRFAAPDESVIDMSVAAAGKAIAHAGIRPEQIGEVLVATVTHPLQRRRRARQRHGAWRQRGVRPGHRLREAVGLHRLLRPLDRVHLR